MDSKVRNKEMATAIANARTTHGPILTMPCVECMCIVSRKLKEKQINVSESYDRR